MTAGGAEPRIPGHARVTPGRRGVQAVLGLVGRAAPELASGLEHVPGDQGIWGPRACHAFHSGATSDYLALLERPTAAESLRLVGRLGLAGKLQPRGTRAAAQVDISRS